MTITVTVADDFAEAVKAGDSIEIDGKRHAILELNGVVNIGIELTLRGESE